VADGQLQLGLIEGDEPAQLLESDLDGAASRYQLSLGEFDQQFHLALLDNRTDQVKIWREPQAESQVVYALLTAPGAADLSFSRNGQFVLAQGGGSFASYDLDHDRDYHFETPFTQSSDQLAEWMDGYRLLGFDKKDLLYVFEYDGANVQKLVTAEPDFGQFFSSDFNGIYNLSPTNQTRNNFLLYTPFINASD
jgi:hypothetical protein